MNRIAAGSLAAVFVLLSGAATCGFAQTAPTLAPDIAARVEQHNRQLHDQLHITAQQQPQWDRFAAVTSSNAADIGQAFSDRAGKLDTMDASENMQSFAHVAQVHAANMQKAADAFQALYATFTSEQKQVADNVFRNKLAAKSPLGRKHAG